MVYSGFKSWITQGFHLIKLVLTVNVVVCFADALGFWHVHQESCGYFSVPGGLVLNVQTIVWFYWVHVGHVLPRAEIPSLPTCCKYQPIIFIHLFVYIFSLFLANVMQTIIECWFHCQTCLTMKLFMMTSIYLKGPVCELFKEAQLKKWLCKMAAN